MGEWPLEQIADELYRLARVGRQGADGRRPTEQLHLCPITLSAVPEFLVDPNVSGRTREDSLARILESVSLEASDDQLNVHAFGDLLGFTALNLDDMKAEYDKYIGRNKPDRFNRYGLNIRRILAIRHFDMTTTEWITNTNRDREWASDFAKELCRYFDRKIERHESKSRRAEPPVSEAHELRGDVNVIYAESEPSSSNFVDHPSSKSYFRIPQRPTPSESKLLTVLDVLASNVRQQWMDEKQHREQRLLLPVRWVNAPREYSDHPVNVIDDETKEQLVLDGELPGIVNTFDSVPFGRLVILGPGGSGKTTLAIELLTKLLDPVRYQPGMPIPIILNAVSWNPNEKSLKGWIAAMLAAEYLTANKIFRLNQKREALGRQLVGQRLLLPILDGFDEIAPELRGAALRELNRYDGPLVMTGRRPEYFDAVDEIGVLKRAAVVELQELTLKDAARFLHRTCRPLSDGTTKWILVFSKANEVRSTVLSEVFSTPLMVSLAGTIYGGASRTDPTELLDEDRFPDADSISDYLLDSFVEQRYLDIPEDEHGRLPVSWTADEAELWLGFLAARLHLKSAQSIDWLDVGGVSLHRQSKVIAGVLGFASIALFIFGDKRPGWIALSGLALGFIAVRRLLLGAWPRKIIDRRAILQNHALPLMISVLLLTTSGMVTLGAKAASAPLELIEGSNKTTNMQLFLSVSISWLLGLAFTVDMGTPRATSPLRSALRSDQIAALAQGAICGVFAASAPMAWSLLGDSSIDWSGILVPISVGLIGTWLSSASGRWNIFSAWHAFNGRLPWRSLLFLEDAYYRGIFRRIGSNYQFKHVTLQDRLAHHYLEKNLKAQR